MKISKQILRELIKEELQELDNPDQPATRASAAKKAQVVVDRVFDRFKNLFAPVVEDQDSALQLVSYIASKLNVDLTQMKTQSAIKTQAKRIGADQQAAGESSSVQEAAAAEGDPELTDPDAGSVEAEREEEAREDAEKHPAAKTVQAAMNAVKDGAVYAEAFKNVILGGRLSASDKLEALQAMFGDAPGKDVFDTITKYAPGMKK
jgi:hypothetical protein